MENVDINKVLRGKTNFSASSKTHWHSCARVKYKSFENFVVEISKEN